MTVRAAAPSDSEALAEIYAHAVLHGFGTFEEVPPPPAEMERRRGRAAGYGLPALVAERDGAVTGFAWATPFRLRPAYRFTAETTVYVRHGMQGAGVGRALLQGVVEGCAARGLRQLVALVGDSGNAASLRLHAACGFREVGVLEAVGRKHGRWVDAVWLQRALGDGASGDPAGEGLTLSET